jgi:tetratricopeptide (TPR) repeat protein
LSEASYTVAYVGDLLTFASAPVHPGLRPGPRLGPRRGTSATAWYDTGCRLEPTDRPGAIAAYERAIAGCPDLAAAHNNLGRLHHCGGAVAVAESCYRLAIIAASDAGPEVGELALYWFNLGVAVEDQGREAEAIAAYERAIEVDATTANAHFNLARLLDLKARRLGDDMMLQRAVRHLLRYRELVRRNVSAR